MFEDRQVRCRYARLIAVRQVKGVCACKGMPSVVAATLMRAAACRANFRRAVQRRE